ncbi:hypothetical protein ACTI_45000 [Actinoplanes sp. OR16]|nr:hypothetical protein ACTI_45000 [Actinoplanes sp. OR16]
MRGRMTAIQNCHVVIRGEQGGGHVRADESGAAGHENMGHGGTVGTPRPIAQRPAPIRQRFVRTAADVTVP